MLPSRDGDAKPLKGCVPCGLHVLQTASPLPSLAAYTPTPPQMVAGPHNHPNQNHPGVAAWNFATSLTAARFVDTFGFRSTRHPPHWGRAPLAQTKGEESGKTFLHPRCISNSAAAHAYEVRVRRAGFGWGIVMSTPRPEKCFPFISVEIHQKHLRGACPCGLTGAVCKRATVRVIEWISQLLATKTDIQTYKDDVLSSRNN